MALRGETQWRSTRESLCLPAFFQNEISLLAKVRIQIHRWHQVTIALQEPGRQGVESDLPLQVSKIEIGEIRIFHNLPVVSRFHPTFSLQPAARNL